MNTIEVNESNELVKRIPIAETPFTIIQLDNKYFGTMGQYRLTEQYDDFESAKSALIKLSWNNILNVIIIAFDNLQKAGELKYQKTYEESLTETI